MGDLLYKMREGWVGCVADLVGQTEGKSRSQTQ